MPDDLTLRIEKAEGKLIAHVGGHLNAETSAKMAGELEGYFGEGACDTDVDFTAIDFIGSAGFKVLLQTHRKLEAGGCRMVIRNLPFKIMAVIKSLGFDKVFNLE